MSGFPSLETIINRAIARSMRVDRRKSVNSQLPFLHFCKRIFFGLKQQSLIRGRLFWESNISKYLAPRSFKVLPCFKYSDGWRGWRSW